MSDRNLIFSISSILCSAVGVQGQTFVDKVNLNKVIPPSLGAASVDKFGQTMVNYSTRKPNISKSIFPAAVEMIPIEVSLSFNSDGVKVDEMTSSGRSDSINNDYSLVAIKF